MTTSSPELRGSVTSGSVLAAGSEPAGGSEVRAVPLAIRELRTGSWTRLGASSVLGDTVTEHTISGLVAEAQAAARAQGYSTGWAEGRRAAAERAREDERAAAARHQAQEERREAEHRQALAVLARAATDLQQATTAVCAQVESQAVEVAVALTEELVGHELAVAEHPGLDAVRRALALAPGETVVRIRVSPDQARRPELAELRDGLAGPSGSGLVAVVADPAMGPGDAVVETTAGVVDARISGALHRVREVLLP